MRVFVCLLKGFFRNIVVSKRKRLIILLVFFLGSSIAYGKGKCERLVATGNAEYPPYLWRDLQDPTRLTGASAEFLQLIAKDLGITIDVLYGGAWTEAEKDVNAGRVDLLAGVVLSLTRLESMDYVHPAFFFTENAVWVRAESEFFYTNWTDLRGKRGLTVAGHGFGIAFDDYAAANLNLKFVDSLQEALLKLSAGDADYVLYERYQGLISANAVGLTEALRTLELPVSTEGLYLALSHNSACNGSWLRGQLARKVTELVAAGVPDQLLRRNITLWAEQHSKQVQE